MDEIAIAIALTYLVAAYTVIKVVVMRKVLDYLHERSMERIRKRYKESGGGA